MSYESDLLVWLPHLTRYARALYRLPVEQREVLLLVALEELSYRDAAEVLGVPVGTVMSRLARARGQMRALLSDEPSAHGTAALRVIGKT